jgi:hypothetical protein
VTGGADTRRALLVAALGFLRLWEAPLEVGMLHRWLDSWQGLGLIVTGMERQGYDVSLTRYPEGWRSTFLRRDYSTRPWVGQVLRFHPTPWQARGGYSTRSAMPKPPRKPKAQNEPAAEPAGVLPMQLRVGDRFTDDRGEWEIVGHPYGTVGGKTVHARVRRVDQPAVTEERSWAAHERVAVRRG